MNKKFRRTEHSTRDSDYVLFLHKLADYYDLKPTEWIHHTHKTAEEKKELAKKRAKRRRKSK